MTDTWNVEAMKMYRRLRTKSWGRVGAGAAVFHYFRTLAEGF